MGLLFLTTFYGWTRKSLIPYLTSSSVLFVLCTYVNKSSQCQAYNVLTLITSSLLENSNRYPPFTDWFLVTEQIKVLLMMAMIPALRTTPVTMCVYDGYSLLLLPFWKAQGLLPGIAKIIKLISWLWSLCNCIVGESNTMRLRGWLPLFQVLFAQIYYKRIKK